MGKRAQRSARRRHEASTIGLQLTELGLREYIASPGWAEHTHEEAEAALVAHEAALAEYPADTVEQLWVQAIRAGLENGTWQ